MTARSNSKTPETSCDRSCDSSCDSWVNPKWGCDSDCNSGCDSGGVIIKASCDSHCNSCVGVKCPVKHSGAAECHSWPMPRPARHYKPPSPPPPLARPGPALYPPSARSVDSRGHRCTTGATSLTSPLACPPQAPQRCATKMDTQTKILSLFLDTRPVFTLGAASWFAPTAGLSPSRPSCDTPSVPERSSTRKLTYA